MTSAVVLLHAATHQPWFLWGLLQFHHLLFTSAVDTDVVEMDVVLILSVFCKTFAAAVPAFPPAVEEAAVVVEVGTSWLLPPRPWPVPPPEPAGSPGFLEAAFTLHSDFR